MESSDKRKTRGPILPTIDRMYAFVNSKLVVILLYSNHRTIKPLTLRVDYLSISPALSEVILCRI